MFYDHHFMGMHWIWWITIVAFVLLLVFNIIPYRPAIEPTEDALEILRKRFARGEIEQEEFEEREKVLKQRR